MIHFRLYDILHRNLAGRNLLVFLFHAGDRKQVLVKVSYYGLSLLVQRGQGRNSGAEMATKRTDGEACAMWWKANESIKRHVYSKRSDSWSFGVLM